MSLMPNTLGFHFRYRQGWQVSAKGGLNRSLNRFKPVRQKEVSASFCRCRFWC